MAQPSHFYVSHNLTFTTWQENPAQPSLRLEMNFRSKFLFATFSRVWVSHVEIQNHQVVAHLTRLEIRGALRFSFLKALIWLVLGLSPAFSKAAP